MKCKAIILVLLLLSIFSNLVYAEDVAYVVKNIGNPDQNLISILNEMSLSYKLIASSSMPSNFSSYRFILVGNDGAKNVPVNNYKSIIASKDYSSGWSSSTGIISSNQVLLANNSNSYIAKGIEGKFQVYTTCCSGGRSLPMYYLSGRKYSVTRITHTLTSSGNFVVATKENPRRVFFGITETGFWTPQTKELFKRSISWILIGEDKDNDGFYYDVDCNDNNAGINPNATEVAYNYIDENCDGIDLADLDGDGFCLSGYKIMNKTLQCNKDTITGRDCNEDNESINPGAVEILDNIDQNCKNDKPILTKNIENIVWEEDAQINSIPTLNLDEYFADYENDSLTYSIYSTSQDENITVYFNESKISFSSRKDWNGRDWVIFKADDSKGGINASNNVSLIVLPINDAPVLSRINDIYSVEGSLVKIIANASDVDNDILIFSFSSPLNSKGEWQTSMGDAGIYNVNVSVSDNQVLDSQEVKINVLPKIVINEFESNPVTGEEWVEFYNPRNSSVDISGWEIWDGLASPKRIHLIQNNILQGNSYYAVDVSGLNNDNEFITLYDSNKNKIDETPVLKDILKDEKTWQRVPNGYDSDDISDWKFQKATKEINNNADVSAPEINLIAPENNSFFKVDNIDFRFIARDNTALKLNCSLYTNTDINFKKIASKEINNGTEGNFVLDDIKDGIYLWQIRCSDGLNEAASEKRSFTIDEEDAPIIYNTGNITLEETETATIIINASDADNDILEYSINDTRFIQDTAEKNIFRWQTGYDDAGVYNLKLIVSDGIFNTEKEFKIIVLEKNRVPIIQEIEQQILNEDTQKIVEVNASDADGDLLSYFVSYEDTEKVECIANQSQIIIKPKTNWNGEGYCTIKVSDGKADAYMNLSINVLPINDAPVLSRINDVTIEETEIATIIINASDIDNDILEYSINDTRFIQDTAEKNIFRWQTGYDDAGEHYFEFSASDSRLEDKKIAKIIVANTNEKPYFKVIPDFTIIEDTKNNPLIENLLVYAYDKDGVIIEARVIEENLEKVDCKIEEFKLYATPAKDWQSSLGGEKAECKIEITDNQNGKNSTIVKINVDNVNDAPEIVSYSPEFNPKITEDGMQEFNVLWKDIDSQASIKWYKDGFLESENGSYTFVGNGESKFYNITAVISDGEFDVIKAWQLTTSDKPLTEKYNGETTDFGNINLSAVNLILEKTMFGKIEFLEPVDLKDIVDLDRYSEIENGVDGIDTNVFSSLRNKMARITFYQLVFDKTPAIYYNPEFDMNASGSICPETKCYNISYNKENKILTFNVDSFSTFFVGDILSCSQKGGFVCNSKEVCKGNLLEARESNCCSKKCVPDFREACKKPDDRIILTIKKPDENDDFKIGEVIEGKIEIENNFDKDKDFNIRAVLYDLTENDEIKEIEDDISIDKNDKEKLSFEINISEDLEDDDDYYLYVYAEDDDNNSLCNENYVKINIKRDKHDVKIEEFKIDEEGICGGEINAEVKVRNFGTNDEDVYVALENKELGINVKSDKFELERFDDKDKATKNLMINIPEDASGNYTIKAKVYYNSNSEEVEKVLFLECEKEELKKEVFEKIQLGKITQKVIKKNEFVKSLDNLLAKLFKNGENKEKVIIVFIDILLIIGIIILLIWIIVKLVRR